MLAFSLIVAPWKIWNCSCRRRMLVSFWTFNHWKRFVICSHYCFSWWARDISILSGSPSVVSSCFRSGLLAVADSTSCFWHCSDSLYSDTGSGQAGPWISCCHFLRWYFLHWFFSFILYFCFSHGSRGTSAWCCSQMFSACSSCCSTKHDIL